MKKKSTKFITVFSIVIGLIGLTLGLVAYIDTLTLEPKEEINIKK